MSTVVLASAGTGKTHTLVDAWLRAVLGLDDDVEGGAPGALLAITFTERAAAEMRARIERRLASLRFTPSREAELLDAFAARSRPVPDAATLDALRRGIARAPIGTFHSMCGRVLREHALAAGIDPAFRILAADDEARMLGELAEAVVLDALAAHDEVVASLVARLPLRGLFAAPGLVEALVGVHGSLAERGLAADAIRAAPPCRDVADALVAVDVAVAAVAGGGGKTVTTKAQAARARLSALRAVQDGEPLSFDDDGDVEAAAARLVAELREGVGGNWGGPALVERRQALVQAVDALGAALVDHHGVPVAAAVRRLLVELHRRQRREKDQRGVLGFGDLLARTRDLLAQDRSVRARVKARFAKVFVDEYQDTSPVQEQIVALLAEAPSHGARLRSPPGAAGPLADVVVPRGRLFVVGDPKQSIYGFRGADAAVFARAVAALTTPNEGGVAPAALRRLSTSRRSSLAVCALVNRVTAAALPAHHGEEIVPLDPPADAAAVEPCGAWWHAGPALLAQERPTLDLEAAVVADRVVALLSLPGHGRPAHAPRVPGEITVLVRRGRAAAVVGRALARRGVPVRVVGGDGFWRRPEILDLVSALALVVDPQDEIAALTVLRSPLVAMSDDQVIAVFEALPAGPSSFAWPALVTAVDDELIDRGVAARVRAFDALLVAIRAFLPTRPLSRCLDLLLDDGGYAVACAVEPDADVRLRHIEKLRALCDGRPEDGVLLVARLLDAIDRPPPEPVILDEPAAASAVRVMTIHQSKGLEAEVIVLADAGAPPRNDGGDVVFDPSVGLAVTPRGRPIARLSPRALSGACATAAQRVLKAGRERDDEERARLLYVALTRARRGVFVVGDGRVTGRPSLLDLLARARAADIAAFDALLPSLAVDALDDARYVAEPSPEDGTVEATSAATIAPAATAATTATTAAVEPLVAGPAVDARPAAPRLRASSLLARSAAQLAMGLPLVEGGDDDDDDDVLPPRARGRLAHAVIALVAAERPDALDTAEDARAAVVAAFDALGAPPLSRAGGPDEALIDALVRTLRGPVRALRDDGRVLSFEEPLVLVTDVVVVEATADLVARGPDDALVVEWKLSAAAARSEAATVQAQACCAALEQHGGHDELRYAVWAVGDLRPPPSLPWGKPAKRALATVLARLATPP
ncbi:MAG: hypothetical protein FJ137_09775 [Deltaproteobacteria bacterium]|nr:hypothetical protein [Deltaproteobacteria bacterium]